MDLYRKTGSGRRYQGRGEDRDKYGQDIRILLGAVLLGEAADFYHFMIHHFAYLYVVFICYLRGDTWLSCHLVMILVEITSVVGKFLMIMTGPDSRRWTVNTSFIEANKPLVRGGACYVKLSHMFRALR